MTATSLQFGPEWMRTKQTAASPSSTRPPTALLSPAPQTSIPSGTAGASSYSSLLAPPAPAPTEKQESVNPFMYSKEDLLQVWRDGGGRGGLGLEVELWEGIVKEIGGEPIGLKEISDAERKLFSLPLNSDLRRRQSHDYLPNAGLGTGDRPKLPHSGSGTHGPLNQQRFGGLGGRRRKDEDNGSSSSALRRPSLSSATASLGVPPSPTAGAFPSSRAKPGGGSNGTDGVSNAIEGNWRRRDTDASRPSGPSGGSHDLDKRDEEKEREEKMLMSHPDANGSFKDPDISRSVSDRSVVPSSSFVRDNLAQSTKEVIAKLGDVSLADEHKTPSLSGSLGTITEGNSVSTMKGEIPVSKPPGIEEDPTSISWSYRDPRGIIQGPFAANLMQKWYDEGYFTPDLLVKRTHLDADWMPVGELRRCADNEKLFFSSFVDHGPPGLGPRPPAPSLNVQSFDHLGQPMGPTAPPQGQHSSPDVPASSRFINSATTQPPDPFFSTSSNPSDSPALTFNTAIAPIQPAPPETPFGVGSARSVFGNNGLEPPIGRMGPFDSQSPSLGVRGGSAAFNANDDPSYTTRMPSLGNREGMFDSQGFTNFGMSATPTSPWVTGISGNIPREADAPSVNGVLPTHRTTLNNTAFSPATNAPGFSDLGSNEPAVFRPDPYDYVNAGFSQVGRGTSSAEGLSSNFGPIGPTAGIRDHSLLPPLDLDIVSLNNRAVPGESARTPGNFGNAYATTSPVIQTPNFGMTANQAVIQPNPHSLQNLPPFNQSSMPTAPLTTFSPHQQPTANLPLTQTSWGAAELPVQPRPLPFNAPHPTSHNITTTPITPNDLVPNAIQQTPDPYNTSKSEIGERWSNISTVSTAQVAPQERSVDSDQGQQSGWSLPPSVDDITEPAQAPRPDPSPSPPQPAPPSQVREPASQATTAPKKRGSGPAQAAQTPVSKAPPAAAVIPPPPQSSASAAPPAKSAWTTSHAGTEDEVKPQKQIGLREIQEAEAKRAEAKKIAERERERAARAHSSAEETQQMYTASWGLPTSQAGASRTAPKEQPPATAAPTPAHVWTNTGKPPQVKRTMKEIQEEEERRKKAAERETAAAAARRAYAESANKSTSTPSGGAWTTVGAGGKPTPNPAVVRTHTVPSSSAAARSPNGVSTARTVLASPQNAKQSALKSQPAADDSPVPPSPEFMKWLREAVRGFNPGFNTEEFMAMLLTFSLDFPPSTVEMIQDMVYMNSATLDGRRFAADFCSKRKSDAATRPKATSTGGKTPSLADVVKTQPKPAQADLEFKMVKKKGRGNAR